MISGLERFFVLIFIATASALNCNNDDKCPTGLKCVLKHCVTDVDCPKWQRFGKGPPSEKSCTLPSDPNKRPPVALEKWFSKEMFADLFPKANLGWGPNACWPYSYEAFVIAARYFPKFGSESPENKFSQEDNVRRDLATFFSHSIQETGENDASLYATFSDDQSQADACFYRGGLFNWFEGGPVSAFLPKPTPGYQPEDGNKCNAAGRYCVAGSSYVCNTEKVDEKFFKGCYFGRGSIQLSYNFNYGQFQDWLQEQNINVDLLNEPNLLMTKMDPPLAIMASLWFYMTPQPPKPSMHDIILGKWKPAPEDLAQNYSGPAFGPTSLVINNECGGEDAAVPGGPGESRRIKAFKWFSKYFDFKLENEALLTCKNMQKQFGDMGIAVSYQPDWSSTWKSDQPCNCAPATYGGSIPYFDPAYYDESFVSKNEANRKKCVKSIYENPAMYQMNKNTSLCLNVPPPADL